MPDALPDSERTLHRATALAWHRGCTEENTCWLECLDAATYTITEGLLSEEDKPFASTSAYWKYTHISGSPWAWDQKLGGQN